MAARAGIAVFALLAILSAAFAQDRQHIFVDVANQSHANLIARDQFEHLQIDLQTTRTDALLLYTDFASRAGNDLKLFLKNMTGFAEDVLQNLDAESGLNDTMDCWEKFEYRMKKIEHDARKAAVYSGDSHHKFLLGHMIVFRMHLNKSEDYLRRSDKLTRVCTNCETTPRVVRWRRLAQEEIHRVQNDIQYSRRSYRDIVSHARRKLNHLKKQAINRSKDAVEQYKYCLSRGSK